MRKGIYIYICTYNHTPLHIVRRKKQSLPPKKALHIRCSRADSTTDSAAQLVRLCCRSWSWSLAPVGAGRKHPNLETHSQTPKKWMFPQTVISIAMCKKHLHMPCWNIWLFGSPESRSQCFNDLVPSLGDTRLHRSSEPRWVGRPTVRLDPGVDNIEILLGG